MDRRTQRVLAGASLAIGLAAAAPRARANLLVDPGFEVNPLTSYVNVLTNFPGFQGIWGVEAATISGAEGLVTPPEGVKMLRMVDDGLVATQAFQVTDVSSYAALIDSGGATVDLGALLNSHVPAAAGGVTVLFFSAANWGSQIGAPITGNITLDSLPATWEPAAVSGSMPIGTRWLVSQVAFSNASLGGDPGYVDAAYLRIVPEPLSLALLALAGAVLRTGRRW